MITNDELVEKIKKQQEQQTRELEADLLEFASNNTEQQIAVEIIARRLRKEDKDEIQN